MPPLISIVIPLYNKKSTIARALDSIISQTISNFEIIIVDGHSTDGSYDIVHSYHDERIHFYSQNGGGASAARNQGINLASCELIAFLDADDQWNNDFLETILSLHLQYPSAGLYGTGYAVYSDNLFIHNISCEPDKSQRIFESYFKSYVREGRPIIITSSCAAPKSVLLSVGGFPENLKIGEDHELFGKIALYYDIAYNPNICSKYYIGAENNADRVDYVLEVPLENYILSSQNDNYIISYDSTELLEYLDHWKVMIGARNVYSGFKKEGRAQLHSVTSPRYHLRKFLFIIISYIPFNFSKISPNKVRNVLRRLHMSI